MFGKRFLMASRDDKLSVLCRCLLLVRLPSGEGRTQNERDQHSVSSDTEAKKEKSLFLFEKGHRKIVEEHDRIKFDR